MQIRCCPKNDKDAYGFGAHGPHTDHGYYIDPGRISCLLGSRYNCPARADTVNFFVDNLKVIEDIREEDPETFELLSTVPVRKARRRLTVQEECDASEVEQYYSDTYIQRPIIYFDENEGHHNLRFSFKQCGFELGPENSPTIMQRCYKAYELLKSKLNDSAKYYQKIAVKEGVAALYNNYRVCNGRGPIPPSSERIILIADISEEVWQTKRRVLMGKKTGLEDRKLYGCSLKALELLANRYEKES